VINDTHRSIDHNNSIIQNQGNIVPNNNNNQYNNQNNNHNQYQIDNLDLNISSLHSINQGLKEASRQTMNNKSLNTK